MPSSLCEVCLPAKVKDRSNKRHPAAAVRVCLAGLSTDLYLPSPPCPTGARPVRVPLPGLGRRCPDLSGCVRGYPLSPGPWPLSPGPWPLPGPAVPPGGTRAPRTAGLPRIWAWLVAAAALGEAARLLQVSFSPELLNSQKSAAVLRCPVPPQLNRLIFRGSSL